MKPILIVVLISAACAVQAETYTDRYDSMNVDDVIGNKRLLNAYIKCMLEEGRCTSDGRELKSHITDALQTGCNKCTDTQKKSIRRVIRHLMEHEQDSWKQLVGKYDPKKTYTNKYEKEIKIIKS